MIGIYQITNLVNGKAYFGQSVDIERRKKEYFQKEYFSNDHLRNSFKKYGKENFSFEIIKCCKEKYLDRFEKLYIRINDTQNPKNGYNKESGGNLSKHISEETKKKLSEANTGKNHPNYGKHRSDKTRKKISESHTGKKLSEETRKKISASQKGKKLSEETRKKMSCAQLGKKHHAWKKYARIVKAGFNNKKQQYAIKFNGKIIKKSVNLKKLTNWFNKNYPEKYLETPDFKKKKEK